MSQQLLEDYQQLLEILMAAETMRNPSGPDRLVVDADLERRLGQLFSDLQRVDEALRGYPPAGG